MLCQRCNKNKATFNIVKNTNGILSEIRLCSECAGLENMGFQFSSDNFIKGLFGDGLFPYPKNTNVIMNNVSCDQCGMTLNEFKETSRFGCAGCYEKFQGITSDMLKKLHGNNLHNGKLPANVSETAKEKRILEDYKKELKAAIRSEEYEKAATFRDKIKELEQKGGA